MGRATPPQSSAQAAGRDPTDRPAPRRSRLPAVLQTTSALSTPDFMATTGGVLMVAASLLVLLMSFLSFPGAADLAGLRWVILTGMTGGAVLLVIGARLPVWSYHLFVFGSIGLITLGIRFTVAPPAGLAMATLYMFIAVDSFLFFPWWQAATHLVTAQVCAVVALSRLGPDGVVPSVMLCGVLGVVGVVVGGLTRAAAAAEVDPLTGLPNRRGFDRELARVLTRAERARTAVCLALIDVDDFKAINDLGGHTAGDRLLRETAAAWGGRVPAGACLARYGGDEFALLLPGQDVAEAVVVVDGLRALMPSRRTCSAGVAAWEPGDTASLLVNRADALLYQSKRAGRNRTTAHLHTGLALTRLREALQHQQLRAVYQPIVELGSGRLTGVEALVRWLHPERGWLAPVEFIPLAEESGLIEEIDRWMLREACAQAVQWVRNGVLDKVTVNVSGRDLINTEYVQGVSAILADTGLPARHLVLEITETTLDADTADVVQTLRELQGMGVRIAIDDFGTGFSSLSRLDRLPVDILKIDRSFVSALQDGYGDAPLVAAVVALGHALGLTLVAEGIEDVHQRERLAELGCDEGQGYLFGRPMPPDLVGRLRLPALPIPRPRTHHPAGVEGG
ncbi:MAG TPA: bifunctional diguanylate cyclase/phosphodiesterase [Kineosporiaceae bacterium]|nr:bifunctional diguanylate cyclase/phosphodiesterase [Kineosporiaceae bacterium]